MDADVALYEAKAAGTEPGHALRAPHARRVPHPDRPRAGPAPGVRARRVLPRLPARDRPRRRRPSRAWRRCCAGGARRGSSWHPTTSSRRSRTRASSSTSAPSSCARPATRPVAGTTPGSRIGGVGERLPSPVRDRHARRRDQDGAGTIAAGRRRYLILEMTETTLMRDSHESAMRLQGVEGSRRPPRHRRLRHRLLLARVPPAVPGRHPQDRPDLHLRLGDRSSQHGPRARPRRARRTPSGSRRWLRASRRSTNWCVSSTRAATPGRASTSAALSSSQTPTGSSPPPPVPPRPCRWRSHGSPPAPARLRRGRAAGPGVRRW